MIENIKSEYADYLFRAIMSLENTEEFYRFFDDLCTVAEVEAMSKRLLAAKLLREGGAYGEISAKTGQSTATISRVNRCLKYGSDGYNIVLNRLNRLDKLDKLARSDEPEGGGGE
jgi:TrpR-related protein YerC/YecD